jgi:hypothetical protein
MLLRVYWAPADSASRVSHADQSSAAATRAHLVEICGSPRKVEMCYSDSSMYSFFRLNLAIGDKDSEEGIAADALGNGAASYHRGRACFCFAATFISHGARLATRCARCKSCLHCQQTAN